MSEAFRNNLALFISLFFHLLIFLTLPPFFSYKKTVPRNPLKIRIVRKKVITPSPFRVKEKKRILEIPKKEARLKPKSSPPSPEKKMVRERPRIRPRIKKISPPPLSPPKPSAKKNLPIKELKEISQPKLPADLLIPAETGISQRNIALDSAKKGEKEPENKVIEVRDKPAVVTEKAEKILFTPLFEVTSMVSFKSRSEPEYPLIAKKMGKEGRVLLEVGISETGKVLEVKIIESAGYGFDQAAREAIFKSTFIPAKVGDKPVAVRVRIPIRFRFKE